MAFYKCQYFFNAGKQGWTETWYIQDTSLAGAYSSFKAAVQKRADLLGAGAVIEALRVSDEDIVGDSFRYTANWSTSLIPKMPAGFEAQADLAESAWLARVEAGDGLYRRSQWFRAPPDDWIKRSTDNVFRLIGDMDDAIKAFRKAATDNGFRLKALSKNPADTKATTANAVAPVVGTPGDYLFNIAAPGFSRGDTVKVSGGTGTNIDQFRGIWTVKDELGGVSLQLSIPGVTGTWQILKPMKIAKRVYTYPAVQSITAVRAATRRTGRAFFVPAGRRRAR